MWWQVVTHFIINLTVENSVYYSFRIMIDKINKRPLYKTKNYICINKYTCTINVYYINSVYYIYKYVY